MRVIAGVHDRTKLNFTKLQPRNIKRVIIQPNFTDCETTVNDIALLEVDNPFEFTEYVKPACLPLRPVEDGIRCIVSGWGKLHPGMFSLVYHANKLYFWSFRRPQCITCETKVCKGISTPIRLCLVLKQDQQHNFEHRLS